MCVPCVSRLWNGYVTLIKDECGVSEGAASAIAVASCLVGLMAGTAAFTGTVFATTSLTNRSLCKSMNGTWDDNWAGCDSLGENVVAAAISILAGAVTGSGTCASVPLLTAGGAKFIGCARNRTYTQLD